MRRTLPIALLCIGMSMGYAVEDAPGTQSDPEIEVPAVEEVLPPLEEEWELEGIEEEGQSSWLAPLVGGLIIVIALVLVIYLSRKRLAGSGWKQLALFGLVVLIGIAALQMVVAWVIVEYTLKGSSNAGANSLVIIISFAILVAIWLTHKTLTEIRDQLKVIAEELKSTKPPDDHSEEQ